MLCPALSDFGHSMVKPRRARLRSGLSGLARGSTVDGAVHRHVTQGEPMTVVLDAVLSNQAGISLVLDGHSLKIEDVAAAARHRQPSSYTRTRWHGSTSAAAFLSARSVPAKSCTGSTPALASLPKW